MIALTIEEKEYGIELKAHGIYEATCLERTTLSTMLQRLNDGIKGDKLQLKVPITIQLEQENGK